MILNQGSLRHLIFDKSKAHAKIFDGYLKYLDALKAMNPEPLFSRFGKHDGAVAGDDDAVLEVAADGAGEHGALDVGADAR